MATLCEFANVWKKQIRDNYFKAAAWAAGGTIVGGIVWGPLGALLGGIAVITPNTLSFVLIFNTRAIVVYIISDDHQAVLQNLSDAEKRQLVEALKEPLVEALKNLSDPEKRQLVEVLMEPLVEALKNLPDAEKRQFVEAFKKPLVEALKEPLVEA